MRKFDTGATRDSEDGKLDYEGFLSPVAVKRYAEYLDSHRIQADGVIRGSDNWQKGIPVNVYMKSLFRHFVDLWMIHRGHIVYDKKDDHTVDKNEALCAVLFNAFGYLHENLANEDNVEEEADIKSPCPFHIGGPEIQCDTCARQLQTEQSEDACPVPIFEDVPNPCPHCKSVPDYSHGES